MQSIFIDDTLVYNQYPLMMWWFPKIGVPQARWMLYNGKSQSKIRMRTGGTPILGNLHIIPSP